ncbi:MAG: carbon-nitrogen hydrolase family protein [Armatimonadetes bacterium]|nr:carbon-nitrogen hydrolase family protein [Armatimonadota bacterium]
MGQMLVEGGEPERNLERAVEMIRLAAAQECRAVVLPECLDLGWAFPEAARLAFPIPGPNSDRLAEAARDGGVYVAAGLTEKEEGRLYNAAVLIGPEGRILLKHRKINILTGVEGIYSTGDRLGVARTDLGTIGVNICADNFPNSLALGHSLARMGAQVILSPSAWAVEADHDNAKSPYGGMWREAYASLARLYGISVVGVSNVGRITAGPWQGMKCIGCSLSVGPDGCVAAEGPYGEMAESLVPVRIQTAEPSATGTDIAGMLADKGYNGS